MSRPNSRPSLPAQPLLYQQHGLPERQQSHRRWLLLSQARRARSSSRLRAPLAPARARSSISEVPTLGAHPNMWHAGRELRGRAHAWLHGTVWEQPRV